MRSSHDTEFQMEQLENESFENLSYMIFRDKDTHKNKNSKKKYFDRHQMSDYVFQIGNYPMWKFLMQGRFEDYIDTEDPEYEGIQLTWIYFHHAVNGQWIEVDSRVLETNRSPSAYFIWTDAQHQNRYCRYIHLENDDIMVDKLNLANHAIEEKERSFEQISHSNHYKHVEKDVGLIGQPRLMPTQRFGRDDRDCGRDKEFSPEYDVEHKYNKPYKDALSRGY